MSNDEQMAQVLNALMESMTASTEVLKEMARQMTEMDADIADLRRRIGLPARKDTNADH